MESTEAPPRFACPDWWEKMQAGETPMGHVPLNAFKAAKAVSFFNKLRLPDVAGNPLLSEACGDWFRDILMAFLASEDPETKARLVVEILCVVPKKNSKTTYVAALALTALFLEDTKYQQMLIVAPSQNIAQRCFSQAEGMIKLDPLLTDIFKVEGHLKIISRRATETKLSVKTFDTSIVTGEIPVLSIIDELHELGKKPRAAAVMQQIRGGGITMKGGQVLMISTQSDEQPAGIWKSELDKARRIRDGKGGPNPILLPIIYEFPPELQRDEAYWRNPGNWAPVLPNLGRSIDPEKLLADYENNGRATKEAEQIWASQHLNIEIGVGLGGDAWGGAEFWEGRGDSSLTLESLIERSEVATVGIDGGGLDDLLGLCVIGREKVTRRWLIWAHAYANPVVMERRKEIASTLRGFEEEGSLSICGVPDDVELLADVVERLMRAKLLPAKNAIGIDPNNVGAIIEALAGRQVPDPMIYRLRQGSALSPAIWGLERKLSDKTLIHSGSEMMAWVLGNVKIEVKGNGNAATKEVAGRAKIDPFIAMLCAAILMSWNPEASAPGLSSEMILQRGGLV